MSYLKDKLQQIKDEVAKENGSNDIDEMLVLDLTTHEVIDEICKRYAEEVIKEASERASIIISGNDVLLDSLKNGENEVNSNQLANCKIKIDKQSILNLIDEL